MHIMLYINKPTDGYEKIHPSSSGYRLVDRRAKITRM